jgi:hypothetical protein
MHLLVPFASDRSEACQHVLRDLALPNLERLLALLTPAGRDEGDAGSFSPPHERALAAAWGWRGGDGLLPFAAHAAAGDGIATGDLAWALLTPSHWQLGRDDVTLLDPALLGLAESGVARAVRERRRAAGERRLRRRLGRERPLVRGARRPAGARDRIARSRHRPQRRSLGARVRARRRRRDARDAVAAAAPAERSADRLPQPRRQRGARGARRADGELVLAERLRAAPAGRCAQTPEIAATLRAPLLHADWAAWAEAWRALDGADIARLLALARAARR